MLASQHTYDYHYYYDYLYTSDYYIVVVVVVVVVVVLLLILPLVDSVTTNPLYIASACVQLAFSTVVSMV